MAKSAGNASRREFSDGRATDSIFRKISYHTKLLEHNLLAMCFCVLKPIPTCFTFRISPTMPA